jgi:glutaredoxin 3
MRRILLLALSSFGSALIPHTRVLNSQHGWRRVLCHSKGGDKTFDSETQRRAVLRDLSSASLGALLAGTSSKVTGAAELNDSLRLKPTWFAQAYDAVGAWLVEHPAPMVLVNNPLKRWVTTKAAGNYDQPKVRAELLSIIHDHDVVVFSATYCPFSFAVKQVLAAEGLPFTAVEWNTLPEGSALVAELGALYGRTSIPAVFIGGKYIGGCNDGMGPESPGLRPLIANGLLDAALENCSPETRNSHKKAREDARL